MNNQIKLINLILAFSIIFNINSNYLFKKYPVLSEKIPYINLAKLPTPVDNCKKISSEFNLPNLYIKRDDLTGKKLNNSFRLFGGNKIRKLEFLLADAIKHKSKTVITYGCAGSNHALATALYCKELGLNCILMLKSQANSYITRRNLLLDLIAETKLYFCPTNNIRSVLTLNKFFKHKQKYGSYPYIIPVGGSQPLGILGFVNAVFELKKQIKKNLLPEPSRIYVPIGSTGTMVGLLLGVKAAQLKSKVIGITIEPETVSDSILHKIERLFKQTNNLLAEADSTFSIFELKKEDFDIIKDFSGKEYGLFTQEAVNAIETFYKTENITLDGVYTGKAFAGLLHDAKKLDKNDNILFWNTFCASNFKELTSKVDYKKLPKDFHVYFETNVQELDQVNN